MCRLTLQVSQKCARSLRFIEYASDVTRVDLALLGIPQCISPWPVSAAAKAKTKNIKRQRMNSISASSAVLDSKIIHFSFGTPRAVLTLPC